MTKITIILIKADVGGNPGHSSAHPALIETAESKDLKTTFQCGQHIYYQRINYRLPKKHQETQWLTE